MIICGRQFMIAIYLQNKNSMTATFDWRIILNHSPLASGRLTSCRGNWRKPKNGRDCITFFLIQNFLNQHGRWTNLKWKPIGCKWKVILPYLWYRHTKKCLTSLILVIVFFGLQRTFTVTQVILMNLYIWSISWLTLIEKLETMQIWQSLSVIDRQSSGLVVILMKQWNFSRNKSKSRMSWVIRKSWLDLLAIRH